MVKVFSRKTKTIKNAATPLARVFEVTGCRTQLELAHLLGIRQSSVSDAKKRNSVPAEWMIKLLLERGVNPVWIMTGVGTKYMLPNTSLERAPAPHLAAPIPTGNENAIMRDILRCFPAQHLVNELKRRKKSAS